jgi:hypothetical protein
MEKGSDPQRDLHKAQAEKLDYERSWAAEFGGEPLKTYTKQAYARFVERIGYDPLAS